MAPDREHLFQKHKRASGSRALAMKFALAVLCLGVLGLFVPGVALAAPLRAAADTPRMGEPVIDILAADWNRTVIRVDFPVESAPSDWLQADLSQIDFALPLILTETLDGQTQVLPPRLAMSLAVATRKPVTTTILSQSWWKEPQTQLADDLLARFEAPAVYRSVPLTGTQIPLAIADGVLRSITLEVSHPATEDLMDYLSRSAQFDGVTDALPWREDVPQSLINGETFLKLRSGAHEKAKQQLSANKAEVPNLFGMTSHWAKIHVDETAIYAVSGQELLLAGISNSAVHPGSLRLYRGGGLPLLVDPSVPDSLQADRVGLNEVAIEVLGAEDGEWNLDDEFRFYGLATSAWLDRFDPTGMPLEHYDHPSAAEAVYWLTWEASDSTPLPGAPMRAAAIAAAPYGETTEDIALLRMHFEEQQLSDIGRVEDNFVWYNSIGASVTEYFSMPGAVADSAALYVVEWRGNTDDDSRRTDLIEGAAWANGSLATRTETSFVVPAQDDSMRVRLVGEFPPLVGQLNRLTLQNTATWSGKRDVSWDSYDIRYWADLDLGAHTGQLDFQYWQDHVLGSRTDLVVTPPTGQQVTLWDVTDPASPLRLSGSITAQNPGKYTFGIDLSADVDRHFVAVTDQRLKSVGPISLANPIALREGNVDVDYIVLYHGSFRPPARDLADFRSTSLPDTDTPVAIAVDVQDVYDNFSGGQKDWRAIRNYLHHVFEAGSNRLRYVCLVGNACRDSRNYLGHIPQVDLYYDFVPTDVRTPFPSNPTYNLQISPYASDDGLVSFEMPFGSDVDYPDVAIGRFPATSLDEARRMIEQNIAYHTETEPGSWRNRILMVADDTHKSGRDPYAGEHKHTAEAEILCEEFIPASLDVDKVYGVAYGFPPGGTNKPEVKADINIAMDRGTTIYHYIGHGSQDSLADERIFDIDDISVMTNGMKRSVFIAFSCDVGVYDSTNRLSMAEAFLGGDGGAVASICASQVSYSQENDFLTDAFYRTLFPERHVSKGLGLGQALQRAKADMFYFGARRNSQRYNVMGDPALVMPHPIDDMEFSVDSLDSLLTGQLHTVIVDGSGDKVAPAAGDSYFLRVEDSSTIGYYEIIPYGLLETPMSYVNRGAEVFNGSGTVGDGDLVIPFMVPTQIRYGEDARVRLMISTADGDHAAEMRVPAARSNTSTSDDRVGPSIDLAFENGLQRVRPGEELIATLEDQSGIAILGSSPVTSILLEFDETGFMSDVTESFVYDADSFTSGRIDLALPADMELGSHVVSLYAADALGNVGSDTLSFKIDNEILAGVESVALFPNPTSGPCRLVFELGGAMDLQWDIYSLAGRRLRTIFGRFAAAGPASLAWDGLDDQADEIANGTYLYVLRGTSADGERPITTTGKLVIMR